MYELVGKSKTEELLEVFDYARAKYGCDQFIIDSLMRLGVAGDDYGTQEAVIFRLTDWAIEKNVHVHLVAHARKGEKDRGAPEAGDIKGAMEIGANAFNILTVWRHRKHEEAIAKAEEAAKAGGKEAQDTLDGLLAKPGVMLNVAKQRNGDYEGKVGLWFDQATYRYASKSERGMNPRRYLPLGAANDPEFQNSSGEAKPSEQAYSSAGCGEF